MGTQVRLGEGPGGARHVMGVAGAWARAGHQVCLLAPGAWPDRPEAVEHLAPNHTEPGLRLELALARRASGRLVLRAPEVGYVRLSASSSALPLALAAARVPLWLELNGAILDELRARGRGPTRVDMVRRSLGRVVALARGLVAVEPSIAEHARRELGAKRVFVVGNGVELGVAKPGDRQEARRRLGVELGARVVGFAGTLSPEIRLDLVLPLLERLDLILLVAGDGPRSDELKDHPRVCWVGRVDHARAIDVLRACDVCLGLREGWAGMRPLESLAVGRRVALWGARGSERLRRLSAELPDFLYVGSDRESFETALVEALDAEARLGPPSGAALAELRRRLGWDETARRLIELFRDG
jgi:glycosyltransferase involved in cell wall biosynthesis